MKYPFLKSDVCDELLFRAIDVDDTYWSKATNEIKAKWFDAIFQRINEIYSEEEELREARSKYSDLKEDYEIRNF